MSARRRITRMVAIVTTVGAGLFGMTATASAAEIAPTALHSCTHEEVTGSLGREGASVTCKGGSNDYFRATIQCRGFDNGYLYMHRGPIVKAGQTSTAWCDHSAELIEVIYPVA